MKFWDLDTQHCVQTIAGHRGEVWSMDVNSDESRLATVSVDKLVRVWTLRGGDSNSSSDGNSSSSASSSAADAKSKAADDADDDVDMRDLSSAGSTTSNSAGNSSNAPKSGRAKMDLSEDESKVCCTLA